ncbi:hypothetical protein [Catelliglobosispora koreensis]|nr:hypothetical protein [Catelliglobosispora koreensis]
MRADTWRITAMAGAVLSIFVLCTLGCWVTVFYGLGQFLDR